MIEIWKSITVRLIEDRVLGIHIEAHFCWLININSFEVFLFILYTYHTQHGN